MRELSLKNSRLDRRYDVLELLGRGSYAEIFLARDSIASPQSPHSQVVIKALNVLMQNDLDADLERTLVENFQNEAIALDRVRHPNVVSRLGHGTARDLRGVVFHYLVLEYLSGGDLGKRCREKSLTLAQSLDYIEQVCAGLAHAHRHGVIHRDIKPQNVLLSADLKTAKIADFGVARFSASETPITRVGTNIYAPPEHSPLLSDEPAVHAVSELTPAADIYSLAKTAFVMITGESPRFFAGRQISELPYAVRQEIWASTLLDVLSRATRQNPSERHQSVEEFWQDLARLKHLLQNHSAEIETHVSTRREQTPRAHVARGYTPFAPQQPKFNTSRELKFQNGQISAKRPTPVVSLDPNRPQPREVQVAEQRRFPAIPVSKPPATTGQPVPDYRPPDVTPAPPPKKKRKFFKRLAVTVVLLAIFGGILYGTQMIVRSLGNFSIAGLFTSRTGTTVRDVPLRSEANARSTQLGWVPSGSRVRIVGENDSWFEVEIVQFGRPREADWMTRGWIAKKAKSSEDNVDFSR
ncbi:MAG: protein kinase [Acidobacteria bacterium]|nr:protein kinase [Acidobacteriota bacterium]